MLINDFITTFFVRWNNLWCLQWQIHVLWYWTTLAWHDVRSIPVRESPKFEIWASFKYKDLLSHYRDCHYKGEMAIRPSYCYNGKPCGGNIIILKCPWLTCYLESNGGLFSISYNDNLLLEMVINISILQEFYFEFGSITRFHIFCNDHFIPDWDVTFVIPVTSTGHRDCVTLLPPMHLYRNAVVFVLSSPPRPEKCQSPE